MRKGVVYYTDNTPEPRIFGACQKQLTRCLQGTGIELVTVSQKPLALGRNVVMELERSVLSMFRQILRGLQECEAEVIFLAEHDVLYHPSHFDFVPTRADHHYYNRNMWHVSSVDGKAVYYLHNDPSHLCAFRSLLLEHYSRVVAEVEAQGFHSHWGFSPPRGLPREMQRGHYTCWMSEQPNVDIRHPGAFTRQRMDRSQFRSEASCREWTEADGVPWWGPTRGRFDEFIKALQ